jgi:hypothetical protein
MKRNKRKMEFMPINICTVMFGSTKMFRIICGNLSDRSAVTIIIVWRLYTEYIFCLKIYAIVKDAMS